MTAFAKEADCIATTKGLILRHCPDQGEAGIAASGTRWLRRSARRMLNGIFQTRGREMDQPQQLDENIINLGPIAGLVGVWEGNSGADLSPGVPDRLQTDASAFRERWTIKPIGKAENHDQCLWGVSCATTAWRLSNGQPFHEQTGYILWDAANRQLLSTFVVPRGISIQAGATVRPDATTFELAADAGSERYGICQNPFLHENFKVVRYVLKITLNTDGSLDYQQDTQLQIKGRAELFHHTDANHLGRVA